MGFFFGASPLISHSFYKDDVQSQQAFVASPFIASPFVASQTKQEMKESHAEQSREDNLAQTRLKEGCLRFHVLGSGSQGNSCVVEGDKGCILIDAGFSKKELFYRLEQARVSKTRIKGIILTHEHKDHSLGIGVVSRGLKVPVYATDGTRLCPHISKELSCIPIHKRDYFEIAGIRIASFPVSHDAQDTIGLRFSTSSDSLAYLTDCGQYNAETQELLSGVRILALESNHDSHMLEQGPYPYHLKRRIASSKGHLSNKQAQELLEKLVHYRLEQVVAMHVSQSNNDPKKIYEALNPVLTGASSAKEIKLSIASQNKALSVF